MSSIVEYCLSLQVYMSAQLLSVIGQKQLFSDQSQTTMLTFT